MVLSVLTMHAVFSQNEKDIQSIKSMCGCYEVTFNFIETFTYDADSTYVGSKEKHDKALEWVALVDDEKDKISLQHLLIVAMGQEHHIVKHWRQDWLYENQDLYLYDYDNQWSYVQLPKNRVKGQWTQKVFQVDDSPRYEGSGTWVHVDGKSYWENETSAPLPRREYTTRNDYNVLFRRNRQEITDYGWLHEQDNDKIVRQYGASDVLIAQEKGYNTYKKVDDSRCKPAQDFWHKHQNKWASVRTKWNEVFAGIKT